MQIKIFATMLFAMSRIYLLLIPMLFLSACTQQGTITTTTTTVQEAKIFINSFPDSVQTGQEFAITWRIEGPEKAIEHTAVHYGLQTRPDAKVPTDYPNVSRIQQGTIPA